MRQYFSIFGAALTVMLLLIFVTPVLAIKMNVQQHVAATNATGVPPKVTYPTEAELEMYYNQLGILHKSNIFTYLSSNLTGNVTELGLAAGGNITYLGFIINHPLVLQHFQKIVYVSVSHNNGLNWTQPVAISNHPLSGDASDLRIAAADNGDKGGLAWVETRNGTTNVWASSTMDSGNTFRTWKLNQGGSTATDPQIVGNSVIQFAWIQHCNQANSTQCQSGVTHHGAW